MAESKSSSYGEFMGYAFEGSSDLQNPDNRTEQDVEALIALLDSRARAGDSRIKLDVVEGEGEVIARQYHHGRCDVGSPWACGAAFDILE